MYTYSLFILATLFTILFIKIKSVKEKSKPALRVILARIPNTIGMFLENAIFKKENRKTVNIVGSILCIVGIVLFQTTKG